MMKLVYRICELVSKKTIIDCTLKLSDVDKYKFVQKSSVGKL